MSAIRWVDQTESTNADLKQLAIAGAEHGTALCARVQTGGRGRLGRVWTSERGNLFCSVLVRTPVIPARVPVTALAAGVGVAIACGGGLQLKWPNDVLSADGRKVAGLLAERQPEGRWMIFGIGINVVSAPPDLPATHLADLGVVRPLELLALDVVRSVLAEIERAAVDPTGVLARWRERSGTLGKQVRVGDVSGLAVDIDHSGALVVQTESGERRRILAGDVEMVS